jgi:SAM-dependent methyltransferase
MMGITGLVNTWLADHAGAEPGQTVLDVAAGTGDLGFAMAERVGPAGCVISSDFSSEMGDVARRNGEARGVSNVEYRVMDAEAMDLDDNSVDAVTCRWGYMLMADPAAALAETRRVLRPGGRLSFAVFGAADRNPWAALPSQVLRDAGHMPPPGDGAPGILALGDRARVRDLVTAAGFAEPRIEEVAFTWRFADRDAYWEFLTGAAGAIAMVLLRLDEDERARVRREIGDRVAAASDGEAIAFPALSLVGWAD